MPRLKNISSLAVIITVLCGSIMSPARMLSQLDSSNLPILVIETENAILDDPKVNGVFTLFANHPSGINKTSHAPWLRHLIGIEYRGQTSQQKYPKKGFGFEFRHDDGEEKPLAILDMAESSDWVIHSPYGDKSLIRNVLTYQMSRDLFDYAPNTTFCELILNGDYYGLVVLTEKIGIGENKVDIEISENPDDTDGGYIFKFDKGDDDEVIYTSAHSPTPESDVQTRILIHDPVFEELSRKQKHEIGHYFKHIEREFNQSDFDDDDDYEDWLDDNSFIDYILISELTKNVDAFRISTYFYKEDERAGGRLKAGPVWDYNIAFGNADFCQGWETTGWALDFNEICPDHDNLIHFWWRRLLQNEDFAEDLIERYWQLRKGLWHESQINQMIDNLIEPIEQAGQRNFERWDVLGRDIWPNYFVGDSHEEEVQFLKEWISARLKWMDENIDRLDETGEDNGFISYRVYPNPAQDVLNLEFRSLNSTEIQVKILDIEGREVFLEGFGKSEDTFHEMTIPVSNLSGVHILEFVVNGKIVVNRKVVFTGK